MELILPQDFYSTIKNRFLLFDTSVFIDFLINPVKLGELFTNFKTNGCTLVTLDAVKVEFIKGATDLPSFNKKELIIRDIIDSVLPITKDIWDESIKLLKVYKEDGKTASVTDLLLASALVKYSKTTFFVTKNLNDFPSNIFTLKTHFNMHHRKGLHSYGILGYQGREGIPF